MRTTTGKLLKARRAGRTVVVSAAPYAGREAEYSPRSKSDPKPWTYGGFRFVASELEALDAMESGIPADVIANHITAGVSVAATARMLSTGGRS